MISQTSLKNLQALVKHLRAVPYDVNRKTLYSAADLYAGYDPADDEATFATCHDTRVYRHFIDTGKITDDVREALARSLHDQRITAALNAFLREHDSHHCVGIMGGHALLRTDSMYRQIAIISKRLTENGFFMVSGGGPGAMEATHLGAWLAGRTDEAVDTALDTLVAAPSFRDAGWLASAFRVMTEMPQQSGYVSLGVPTFLYGHEPSTPFATHIAKYFENSIREDTILTIAYGGIIYTPGSAGTMQEIFQDAVQNHYLSFGFSSPMIFMGKDFWTNEMPIYPLLQNLSKAGLYKNLRLTLTDDTDVILNELLDFRRLLSTM